MVKAGSRQEAKAEQIRAAARRLFLQGGFAETSMDAVTMAAGVSKQTLYRYYPSKADLFAAVLSELIQQPALPAIETLRSLQAPRTQVELEEQLVRAAERLLTGLMEPQQLALLKVVISEAGRVPELRQSFRSTVSGVGGAGIADVLERGRASGVVADWVDLRTAGRALAGLLLVFVVRDGLLAAEPRPPGRKELREIVRILVRGIAGGASGRDG